MLYASSASKGTTTEHLEWCSAGSVPRAAMYKHALISQINKEPSNLQYINSG